MGTDEEQSGTIESQEKSGIDSTREITKDESKVKLNKRLKKLSSQLTKHFNVNKKMQNQLSKLNKMVNGGSRQQLVIRNMQAQIKVIETQLTKINSGIARFKTSSKQGGKTGNKKAKTKVSVR
jgi:predicted RNase H-like nuclease (RuvC/YqgF family)